MNIDNGQVLKSEIGQTRFAPNYPQKIDGIPELDVIHSAGWHKVNDLYKYDRPNGITNFLLIFTVSGKGEAYVENKKFYLTEKN